MPRRAIAAAVATSLKTEFAGVGWDTTRALMPFSNEFANILVQSSIAPASVYDHSHDAPLLTSLSTNFFDLLALTGIMLNVVQATSMYGQKKGMRVGLLVAFLAFIVPNSMLAGLTNLIVGCTLPECAGTLVSGKLLKLGRLVAGVSIVWVLEATIELAKEMACHPTATHAHLQALLPLSAALGWTGALHVGLRYGKAAGSHLKSAFTRATANLDFKSIRLPGRKRGAGGAAPSSPPPTPNEAAAKAAAKAAEPALDNAGPALDEADEASPGFAEGMAAAAASE